MRMQPTAFGAQDQRNFTSALCCASSSRLSVRRWAVVSLRYGYVLVTLTYYNSYYCTVKVEEIMLNRFFQKLVSFCQRLFSTPSARKLPPSKAQSSPSVPPTSATSATPNQVGQMYLEMGSDEPPLYQTRSSLLTFQERKFENVLQMAVSNNYRIFVKVRMGDVISIANEPKNCGRHMNQIFCKHLDFVLCEGELFRPVLIIELDDSSHSHYDRRASDDFKEKVCKQAAIPLLRVKIQAKYDPIVLREKLDNLINSLAVMA
jgi:hypothetical protein